MKLSAKMINDELEEKGYGRFECSYIAEKSFKDGARFARKFYESMFDSELAILLSKHVHDICGDNVPHDIGLTLLEVIKNYKKGE